MPLMSAPGNLFVNRMHVKALPNDYWQGFRFRNLEGIKLVRIDLTFRQSDMTMEVYSVASGKGDNLVNLTFLYVRSH